jgi:CheY-like chemotaxis protein
VDVTDDVLLEKLMVFHDIEKPTFEGEVLLCEDNEMNQQVICEHLSRVGLKTIVAENGRIGVDMVQERMKNGEKQFDLIFMDMHMPVMDGLEASAEIMKLNSGIPIVAMTANTMSEDIEIYKMSGMNDCVGKPFTSQELWQCLLKYFTPVEIVTSQKNEQLDADMEFLKKIQILFVKNNQQKYEEIVKALYENDIMLAYRLAHTLKSNAGQIGKTSLQQAAASVESQLKDGNNNVTPSQLNILETELKAVFSQLVPMLNEMSLLENESEPRQWLDREAALELIEKLEPLLKMGSPECMDFLEKLKLVQESDKLSEQIDDFDFESAMVSLIVLKEKINNML